MEYNLLEQDGLQVAGPGPDPGLDDDGMGAVSEACHEAVMALFPDMCPDHLNELGARFNFDHEQVIGHVIDQQDLGLQYPKWDKSAKRKRQEVSPVADGPAEKKMKFNNDPARLVGKDSLFLRTYKKAGKTLLAAGFPQFYAQDIEDTLNKNGNLVYPAYKALEDNFQNKDGKPKLKLKPRPKANPLDSIFDQSTNEAERMADDEYRAAKAESQKRKEEELHLDRARAQGLTADCGCCYEEFALDRMVHCNGEILHWFCPVCAKKQADAQIGLSKYELSCMSMDGCHGGFSHEQRKLFLDEATTIALDRIEKEAVLRLAGIENLAKCPFCFYAAEYPSVEENKEFQCENPACGKRSCRLCDMETHIPKTCREARAEEGHSGRHRIEEAMSEAMIRKCNKCKTPFIKENGCNKMTCTAVGCRNVQCYVCSKSCDYAHFDDTTRGGKKGQCPLFDSVDQRHEDEVKAAELKARERVAQENPNIDAEAFQFNFSERVKQDEERRKANIPAPAARRAPVVPLMPPDVPQHRAANDGQRQQQQQAAMQAQLQEMAQQQQAAMQAQLQEMAQQQARMMQAEANIRAAQARAQARAAQAEAHAQRVQAGRMLAEVQTHAELQWAQVHAQMQAQAQAQAQAHLRQVQEANQAMRAFQEVEPPYLGWAAAEMPQYARLIPAPAFHGPAREIPPRQAQQGQEAMPGPNYGPLPVPAARGASAALNNRAAVPLVIDLTRDNSLSPYNAVAQRHAA